tara:strand:+ start:204 stop:692 length:489 start_codon:yes stop_codon:yes gene_type:complete
MPKNSRHRRFYSSLEDKKPIAKLQIKSGMIVEFNYRDKNGSPSKPLVFVMDTNEYVTKDKKTFSGINLNYIPAIEIERLFKNIIKKAGFELDRETKFPKVDLYEEEDVGVRPRIIWKPFVKEKLMNRFDCWRTFKYTNIRNTKQIKYNFTSKELKEIYNITK